MVEKNSKRVSRNRKKVIYSVPTEFIAGIFVLVMIAAQLYPHILFVLLSDIFGKIALIFLLAITGISAFFVATVLSYTFTRKTFRHRQLTQLHTFVRFFLLLLLIVLDCVTFFLLLFYFPVIKKLSGGFSSLINNVNKPSTIGIISIILTTLLTALSETTKLKHRETNLLSAAVSPRLVRAESMLFIGNLALLTIIIVFAASIRDISASNTVLVGLLILNILYYVIAGVLAPTLIRTLSEVYKDEVQESQLQNTSDRREGI